MEPAATTGKTNLRAAREDDLSMLLILGSWKQDDRATELDQTIPAHTQMSQIHPRQCCIMGDRDKQNKKGVPFIISDFLSKCGGLSISLGKHWIELLLCLPSRCLL